ncbi:TPA: 3'-5' exonuclease [Klebsiella oxytoca]|nr:3'-5' exonuclease [Klebsiella oxytoca]
MTDKENEDVEARRHAALAEDRCFTRSRLKDEFRMKPSAGAEPVKWYKGQYGKKYAVYRIADCVPMRVKREQTEKQRQAASQLAQWSRRNSKQGRASSRAVSWLAQQPLFLDAETTGLGRYAQAIEIALVESTGECVFETRLRPSVGIEPGAQAVHGISEDVLSDAPQWPDIAAQLRQIIGERPLVIFNADYDMQILRQTAAAYGDPAPWLNIVEVHCAMYLSADFFGATNRYGTISLASAALYAGVAWPDRAHAAITDATVTASVVSVIADYYKTLCPEQNISE